MDKIVTVVIPVAESHINLLPRALRSLKNQSIQTHELIVVNDSGKPLRCNDGAKVLNTKGHEGQSRARNIAIEKVTTPFLLFLDADDELFTTTVETLVRAYATYDAGYLYGDALQVSANKTEYFTAPLYDRHLLFQRNLHNVTALLPTDYVKEIGGFDEEIKGWEDWEFYVRMAINGYCGEKVPQPLFVYHVNTGISRERHREFQQSILADMKAMSEPYENGKETLMGCCGSNVKAKQAAQKLLQNLPADADVEGYVMMEYLGGQQGTVPFRVGENVYRGANDSINRFVRVKVEDAPILERYQVWRKVPSSVLRARRPEPEQASNTVTQQSGKETATELAAGVSVPVCKTCGHISMFHMAQGCQALMGGDHICGCERFNLLSSAKEPDGEISDSGRTPAHPRKARRNAGASAKTTVRR